jgi:hypothetical protein
MSSLFLNGLYTTGINSLSEISNLLLGGTNTNNIQILSPIIGDGSNTLTFSSINTTDIVNKITQNFCFNSTVPSASISVTHNSSTDDTSITLDATNININNNLILNYPIIPNYNYTETSGTNNESSIGYIYSRILYNQLLLGSNIFQNIIEINNVKKGIYIANGFISIKKYNSDTIQYTQLSIASVNIQNSGIYGSDTTTYNSVTEETILLLSTNALIILNNEQSVYLNFFFKSSNNIKHDILLTKLLLTRIV